jgi:hypothetical protein
MGHNISGVLSEAWLRFEEQVLWLLPHVLASLLVLAVGVLLGLIVRRIGNWLLVASQVDRRLAKLGLTSALETVGIRSSVGAIAGALQWAIIFGAAMLALYSLDARLASDLTERFLLYLPHMLVAVAILAAGGLAARFVGRSVLIAAVNAEIPAARLLAGATRAGVMLLAIATALEHLGIGRATLLTAFAILFGGATLAGALALGLGLQDLVRRWVASQALDPSRQREPESIHHW